MIEYLKFFDGGYCTHLERVVLKTGRYCNTKFPSIFSCIKHKKFGYILYDTGYSHRFFTETKKFPYNIYAKLTPVFFSEKDSAVTKLKQESISPNEINYIIISHFHADHIAALKDFKNAKFIYFEKAYDDVKNLNNFKSLKKGFIPNLLPSDFIERSLIIDRAKKVTAKTNKVSSVFEHTYDIFEDKSLFAVELPGHSKGQLGLFLNYNNEEYFLVADSCWMSESFEKNILPSNFSQIISSSKKEYIETIELLHKLFKKYSEIKYIPSHCGVKFLEHVQNSNIKKNKMNGL